MSVQSFNALVFAPESTRAVTPDAIESKNIVFPEGDERFEDESVWLTQQQIAELFQKTIVNVNMHMSNVYEEGELSARATIKKFLTVRTEGKHEVKRLLDYYNLDMIISVGYRVKSSVATRFCIWAVQQQHNIV